MAASAGSLWVVPASSSAFVYTRLQPKRTADQKVAQRARAREARAKKVRPVSVAVDRS